MQQIVDNQQLKDIIKSARRILLVSGIEHNLDKITAMIALGQALEAKEKKITLMAEGLDKSLLVKIPEAEGIAETLEPRSLRISIKYGSLPVEKINYESREGVFELYLAPYTGTFSKDQIEFDYTGLDYDLILTIGATTLKDLGSITQQYSQALENTLVVNIDNNEENSMFGKINLIDPSAETRAQLVYDVIKSLGSPINAITASLLLAGVMEKTKTLREDVSPRLLKFSALLLDKNADWKRVMQAATDFISQKPISQPLVSTKETKREQETELPERPLEQVKEITEEATKPVIPLAQKVEPTTEVPSPKGPPVEDETESIR